MAHYALICLDIDGTLLDPEHRLTQATIDAVGKACEIARVVLVSARMPSGIAPIADALRLPEGPQISYGGALVLNGDEVLYEASLPGGTPERILEIARPLDVHVSLYRKNRWIVEKMDQAAQLEAFITGLTPEIIPFENIAGQWDTEGKNPHKLLCIGEPKKIGNLAELLNRDPVGRQIQTFLSKPDYLEILNPNVSKSGAIAAIAGRFGIAREAILAIGDQFNDLDMLEYAGLGIAMGNAPEEVKQRADACTLTNAQDGVAFALRKYLLP